MLDHLHTHRCVHTELWLHQSQLGCCGVHIRGCVADWCSNAGSSSQERCSNNRGKGCCHSFTAASSKYYWFQEGAHSRGHQPMCNLCLRKWQNSHSRALPYSTGHPVTSHSDMYLRKYLQMRSRMEQALASVCDVVPPCSKRCHSHVQIFLSNNTLGIVHEYAAMGTVYDMLKNQGPFPESLARFFFQQLVCGVRYLHERGVAHREIRLKHLLVKSFNFTTSTVPVIKITHFSAAKEDSGTGPACMGPSTSQTRSHSTHSGSRSQTQGSRGHVRSTTVRPQTTQCM